MAAEELFQMLVALVSQWSVAWEAAIEAAAPE